MSAIPLLEGQRLACRAALLYFFAIVPHNLAAPIIQLFLAHVLLHQVYYVAHKLNIAAQIALLAIYTVNADVRADTAKTSNMRHWHIGYGALPALGFVKSHQKPQINVKSKVLLPFSGMVEDAGNEVFWG